MKVREGIHFNKSSCRFEVGEGEAVFNVTEKGVED